jgi:hypothetical protein
VIEKSELLGIEILIWHAAEHQGDVVLLSILKVSPIWKYFWLAPSEFITRAHGLISVFAGDELFIYTDLLSKGALELSLTLII